MGKNQKRKTTVRKLRPCALLKLKTHSCRWPLWEDNTPPIERLFCAAWAEGIDLDRPYCEMHTRMASRILYKGREQV